jgi:cytochrome c-type biogenesis protein CcmH
MRTILLPVAGAALLALLAVAAVTLFRLAPPSTMERQVATIAGELRCPDCQGLSVAESHTAAAAAIRAEIRDELEAGRSAAQVRQHFVDRYGEWILLIPASPLPWLVPVAVLLGGGAWLAWWIWRRGATRPGPATAESGVEPKDEAQRMRVREEVETLDA